MFFIQYSISLKNTGKRTSQYLLKSFKRQKGLSEDKPLPAQRFIRTGYYPEKKKIKKPEDGEIFISGVPPCRPYSFQNRSKTDPGIPGFKI